MRRPDFVGPVMDAVRSALGAVRRTATGSRRRVERISMHGLRMRWRIGVLLTLSRRSSGSLARVGVRRGIAGTVCAPPAWTGMNAASGGCIACAEPFMRCVPSRGCGSGSRRDERSDSASQGRWQGKGAMHGPIRPVSLLSGMGAGRVRDADGTALRTSSAPTGRHGASHAMTHGQASRR